MFAVRVRIGVRHFSLLFGRKGLSIQIKQNFRYYRGLKKRLLISFISFIFFISFNSCSYLRKPSKNVLNALVSGHTQTYITSPVFMFLQTCLPVLHLIRAPASPGTCGSYGTSPPPGPPPHPASGSAACPAAPPG